MTVDHQDAAAFVRDDHPCSIAWRRHDLVIDNPTIVEPHARSVRIKDAHNPGIDSVGAMIGHGDRFGKTFGFIINSARTDGIDIAPVGLFLRMLQRIAVHFRSGSNHKARFFFFRHAERIESSQ